MSVDSVLVEFVLGKTRTNSKNSRSVELYPVRRSTCSQELLALLVEGFPAIAEDQGHRNMMGLILFGSHLHSDTGNVLLCHHYIEACYRGTSGRKYGTGSNFRALSALERFRREVLPEFSWTEPDYKRNRCRVVKSLGSVDI